MSWDLSRAHWRTSSYSGGNANCVQVAVTPVHIGLRDSKNSTGPALVFAANDWTRFVRHL